MGVDAVGAADEQRRRDILAVVAEEAAIEPAKIEADTTLADLGISSLDFVELIFKIESRFGIEVPTEGPFESNEATVHQLVDHVAALIDAQAGRTAPTPSGS